MSKVFLDISMSLDGFIAGTNDTPEQPLGDGGTDIQAWLFNGEQPSDYNEFFKLSSVNKKIFDTTISNTGAMVVGRNTFDIVNGWNGSHPIQGVPIFVVTHQAPAHYLEEQTSFTFVTDGVKNAVQQAKKAAKGKDISIGTANIAQQCMKAGLLDEIHLHVSPILLGKGTRLFDHLGAGSIKLESLQVIDGATVTHLMYKLIY
ncbi:dihydrofolate reductase family protein [Gracilibacillus alcaliphilus]|uniref:dihydrofolate reductase family protein n=1 Tax=Gracilibacillus alcaliphilus TaxID=1401441 RepID=UPI00195D65CB|nr:dihydrofolate reductase family protein [Gracilibacillus alcaliphilus]MBM7679768.1 dihydrofolate reductase [Gracilibacillus alcaliphilus]